MTLSLSFYRIASHGALKRRVCFMKFQRAYVERRDLVCRLVSIKYLFTNISYLVRAIYSSGVHLGESVASARGNKLRARGQPETCILSIRVPLRY